ncbi:hypothetical protein A2643_02040 [Candidatus Nomurabacteria bacterium RIFCSPHIGHO2_01_FULL_39_220]|uniref:DUF5652 domain-containing protein n=1 Tax=Candidatus Nomurabacteria bacterium RIFCSPLOWO2_02_FULL_40_67 TaxID=1801787 RepID=A0A1F6Y505_9BACT|nr:MAG: hypothetical protein UU71_C0031G0001 [Parcubacteria group bacterium GW2011_GWB1_41_6]OGI63132.1 MAG: hypothetical protein A2W12_04145 [Candidatus Nomurabacteria bacterium RBG_16_40_11]OGI69878.1 MAG: hypothetical protein A2643_02040 [Candidatus Nomurabacteria bacterium RIFCSPHIGHO2_01_FULL_39_220]OGI72974.1 MAG: hypothetical protein A2W56_00715 [Candidatus Nomurabacteria bacterium RIFCSPHIGHO2_02_41_18]OGI78413.1 MAG: hypothetical protein A3C65_03520 [Candidatus Nomurabacteria bacterium
MDQLPLSANILILILLLWSIAWKIYGAWTAAKHDHKKWFVAIIILNTVGILEIFYVLRVAKKSWAEVKGDFKEAWKSRG